MKDITQNKTHEVSSAVKQRLFFALEINEQDKQQLSQWRQHTLCHALNLPDAKLTLDSNLHLTLVFLGMINTHEVDKLCHGARQLNTAPIDITFDQLGYFSKPKMLYISPRINRDTEDNDQPLYALAEQLKQIGVHTLSEPPATLAAYQFLPHITLCRGYNLDKANRDKTALPAIDAPITISFSHFSLYESARRDGVLRYTPIARFAL